MSDNKRKEAPGASHGSAPKKSRGSGGKWKTPHFEAKEARKLQLGTALEVGDQGFWVTYARGMRSRAMREMSELCEEYGETMYGLKRESDTGLPEDDDDGGDDDGPADIEASIEKELDSIKEARSRDKEKKKTFTIILADVECLFFVKTLKPVEPKEMVQRICLDARDSTDVMKRKTKYINRLTPVSSMNKSTEKGLIKVARAVMAPYFRLREADTSGNETSEATDGEAVETEARPDESTPIFTYAIRQNIRNHSGLKSSTVIKQVADLPITEHKVNLTTPDKVVLIEIYQTFCGVAVVDGTEWENLKRYNLNELYKQVAENSSRPKVSLNSGEGEANGSEVEPKAA